MKTLILSQASTITALSNSATRYAAMASGRSSGFWGSSNAATMFAMPYAGTITSLRGRLGNAISGGGSYTLSVQKNGADVLSNPLSAQITSGQDFSDLSHNVPVSAGDTINYKIVPASTPTSQTFVQMSCLFESSAANRSVIFAVLGAATIGASVYVAPGAKYDTSTETLATVPMPTAGVFESMYITSQGSPPGSGNSLTFTLKVNGSATGLTYTWSGTSTPTSITGQSVSVSAGDYITIEVASVGTAVGANISLGFQPTTDGESCQFSTVSTAMGTSTVYLNANGRAPNNISTVAESYNVAPVDFVAKKLRVRLSSAPGTTYTRTLTLYDNGSSTGVTASLGPADTVKDDSSNTFSVTGGDPIYLKHDFTGNPVASSIGVGWVSYIAPAAGGGSTHGNLSLLGVG